MHKKIVSTTRLLLYLYFVLGWLFFDWAPVRYGFNAAKVSAATQTFTVSGTWQAPAGVSSVTVEAWGAGGAGGGRGSSTGQSGGGGGGAYATKVITVIPLQNYAYTVGTGGSGGTGAGPDGGFSQWATGTEIKAAGGKGGAVTTTKGLGGAIADSVGTTVYKGGDGGDAPTTLSGGGGGGAGSTGAGGNATGSTAGTGTAQAGGGGGAGVSNANGNVGLDAGGGGSGARRTNGNRSGGSGANGQIRITYNSPPTFSVEPTDSPDPVNYGQNVTFTATATDTDSNQWYLAVCKTNNVSPGLPPACASNQTLCISASAVASGSQNSCTWTSNVTGAQDWFAFACDSAETDPYCSSASTTSSPVTVNAIISVSVTSDGTVSYGTLNSGQTTSTLDLADTQTAKNDGNIAEDFSIKTSAPAGWTLGSTAGNDVFVHEFSTNAGGTWTKFVTADGYQTLLANIAPNNSQNFDLRFTAPSPSTSGAQKTITITIQATQH
jgi:hypothetical protein